MNDLDLSTRRKKKLAVSAALLGLGGLFFWGASNNSNEAKRVLAAKRSTIADLHLKESNRSKQALVQGTVHCKRHLISPQSHTQCCFFEYSRILFGSTCLTSERQVSEDLAIKDSTGVARIITDEELDTLPTIQTPSSLWRNIVSLFGYHTSERVLRPGATAFVLGEFSYPRGLGYPIVQALPPMAEENRERQDDAGSLIFALNTPEQYVRMKQRNSLVLNIMSAACGGLALAISLLPDPSSSFSRRYIPNSVPHHL